MKIPEMNRNNKILLLLALIVIAIPSYFIYDYTQHNPKFCTTCHLMTDAYNTWEGSAMHDLTCHECHIADMATNINHMVEVLTEDPQVVVKPAEIDNELCEECHASEDPQWLQVVNTAGHQVHFYGNDDHADCIECHGMSLHSFRPPEDACLECHDADKEHATESMLTDCLECHEFLANGNVLVPERENCVECHEDKSETTLSMPEGAHSETTCLNCHSPHDVKVAEDCETCHTVNEGLHAIGLHTDCQSCHVPHEEVVVRETCESCHVDRIDHYAPANCISCHG